MHSLSEMIFISFLATVDMAGVCTLWLLSNILSKFVIITLLKIFKIIIKILNFLKRNFSASDMFVRMVICVVGYNIRIII